MTHTPGPWNADRQYVIDADALTVARVASHGARAQYEANARLIAAAPAMLDTLRQTLHYLYEDGATGYIVDDIEEVIRAAGAEL